MALTEADRRHLHNRLIEVAGEREGTLMMEEFSNGQVLARFDELRADVRTDVADIRTEMADIRTEMADIRTEMAELRSDVHTQVAELRADTRSEMAGLRSEMHDGFGALRVELHTQLRSQMRWMIGFMMSMTGLLATLTLTVH